MEPKHQIGKAILFGVGLVAGILVLIGVVIGFFVWNGQGSIARYMQTQEEKMQDGKLPPSPSHDVPTMIPGEPVFTDQYVVTTGTDAFGNYVTQTDGYGNPGVKDYSVQFINDTFAVDWHRGAKQLSHAEVAAILKNIDQTITNNQVYSITPEDLGPGSLESCVGISTDPQCQMHIYEAGVLTSPQRFAGKKVYFVFVPGFAPGFISSFGYTIAFLDDVSKKFVSFVNGESTLPAQFQLGIIQHVFSEITPPKTIQGSQNGVPETATLVHVKSYYPSPTNTLFGSTFGREGAIQNHGGITNVIEGKIVPYSGYTNANTRFVHALGKDRTQDYGPVYTMDKGYHIILPDGSVQVYDLLPDFMETYTPEEAGKLFYPTAYIVRISWTDGRKESANEGYIVGGTIGSTGFCAVGVVPCTNIVTNEPWFEESNLQVVGKTFRGDPVYELTDKATNPFYKSIFDYGYLGWKVSAGDWNTDVWETVSSMPEEEKYTDFLNEHPVFFWKDPDGNWRVYQKAHYQSAAECGKPVIYLYPERDTTVRVQVAPTGGFTKVEPAYPEDGWLVRATPQSQLYNFEDKKTYPYLFWEGIGYNYARPEEGFVFAKADVPVKVREVLRTLGLNEKETEDFMEFWEPKLMVKPYVFVTFLPQTQFDQMAPLTVEPKPDTVIRVFMDYEPMEKPIDVRPLSIRTPERKGFTVVEWGGALHR